MFTKSGDLRGTPEDLGTLSWSTPWYFNWQDIKHAQNVINFINLGGLQAPRSKKKNSFLIYLYASRHPVLKLNSSVLKWLPWAPACSSCSHIERFKMIYWCVAVTHNEQVHHSRRGGAVPRVPVSFARASISSWSLSSSSAQFISPECPSYRSALLTLYRDLITSCQEKEKVPWGRFKGRFRLKTWSGW